MPNTSRTSPITFAQTLKRTAAVADAELRAKARTRRVAARRRQAARERSRQAAKQRVAAAHRRAKKAKRFLANILTAIAHGAWNGHRVLLLRYLSMEEKRILSNSGLFVRDTASETSSLNALFEAVLESARHLRKKLPKGTSVNHKAVARWLSSFKINLLILDPRALAPPNTAINRMIGAWSERSKVAPSLFLRRDAVAAAITNERKALKPINTARMVLNANIDEVDRVYAVRLMEYRLLHLVQETDEQRHQKIALLRRVLTDLVPAWNWTVQSLSDDQLQLIMHSVHRNLPIEETSIALQRAGYGDFLEDLTDLQEKRNETRDAIEQAQKQARLNDASIEQFKGELKDLSLQLSRLFDYYDSGITAVAPRSGGRFLPWFEVSIKQNANARDSEISRALGEILWLRSPSGERRVSILKSRLLACAKNRHKAVNATLAERAGATHVSLGRGRAIILDIRRSLVLKMLELEGLRIQISNKGSADSYTFSWS